MTEHKFVPGHGPTCPKLMVVGECPTPLDTAAGKITSNKEVDHVLLDAGIRPSEVWMTNASKFFVPSNEKGGRKIPFGVRAATFGVNFEEQISWLVQEIKDVQPNCILALGGTALYALTGKSPISFFRGSILQGPGSKLVSTYDPRQLSWQSTGAEFKGYWNRQLMVFDAKRALYQSQFKELRLPFRYLEIARDSAHFAEFLNRYPISKYPDVSVDIEAGGHCVPICIGFAFTPEHGFTVPLWNEDGISTIPDSDMVQLWIMIQQVLMERNVIGQNFILYDRDKIQRLGFKVKEVKDDIMMKSHAINPELPKGLAHNVSIYTEEPAYKDDGMYKGSYADLFTGCARDACVTFEVNSKMDLDLVEIGQVKFYRNFLMRLPEMYSDIQNQGFTIDPTERDRLIRKYIEWDERLGYELFQLVGDVINVNSSTQVKNLLFENWKLPYKDSTGEEAVTELLNSPKVKDESIRKALELILLKRRVLKSINTYMMALPDFDGKMKTSYYICLDTGRTSTGQQDAPMRPTVEVRDIEGKKKNKVLGIAFQTMTKHGDVGADIRGMYIPDSPDEVFVGADSAQAEARVIFLLADDEVALTDIDTRDYHALTASWFFGGSEDTYSKKKLGYEHPIRFVGKTLRHAGHLGAGKRRACISVNTDARKFGIPITITEQDSGRALDIFHKKQPRIQQIFQAQAIECLKKNRTLVAPLPYGIASDVGGRRTFYERWGEELFRQAFSYIPQRAVSDNTKNAMLRIRARIPGIKIIMEAHDGILFCIPRSKVAEYVPIIKAEMERPIDFSRCSLPRRELVIPCEIEIGKNYRDMNKFKDLILDEVTDVTPKPMRTLEERMRVPKLGVLDAK